MTRGRRSVCSVLLVVGVLVSRSVDASVASATDLPQPLSKLIQSMKEYDKNFESYFTMLTTPSLMKKALEGTQKVKTVKGAALLARFSKDIPFIFGNVFNAGMTSQAIAKAKKQLEGLVGKGKMYVLYGKEGRIEVYHRVDKKIAFRFETAFPQPLLKLVKVMEEIGADGASMEYYSFAMLRSGSAIQKELKKATYVKAVKGADVLAQFIDDKESILGDLSDSGVSAAEVALAMKQLEALVGKETKYDQYSEDSSEGMSTGSVALYVRADKKVAFRFETGYED